MAIAKNVKDYINEQKAAIAANPECGNSHYNLGIGLMGLKKYDEAEKAFQRALDCSPSLAEAYVQLGAICLQRGDMEGCLEYNKIAVKVRPGFSEAHGNIGFIEIQRGNVDEAIKYLERATHFNFRFIQAMTTLANAYLMKGRIDDSIDMNLKALKIEPDFGPGHNNLAVAYLEKGEIEPAAEHCRRAQELGYNVSPELIREIESHRSSRQ